MYLCVWNYCALSNLYWRISHWMGFAVIMLSVGAEKRTSELCSASTNTRFPQLDTEYCVNQRLNFKGNIIKLKKTISIICPKLLSRLGEIKVDGMYFLKLLVLISARENSYSKVASRSTSRLVAQPRMFMNFQNWFSLQFDKRDDSLMHSKNLSSSKYHPSRKS